MFQFTLPVHTAPIRLKTALKQYGVSDRYWKKLKASGTVKVNGIAQDRDQLLKPGDRVEWNFLPESSALLPEEAELSILYEDDVLLAVAKPAGLLTHNPGKERISALSRRVAGYYQQKGIAAAVHPVSRLDKETSGLVLFAKNACIHHMMTNLPLTKVYLGLTEGWWDKKAGTLDGPIARKPGSIIERMIDYEKGQPAETRYQVVAEGNGMSLLRFILNTGRTHQIRVHCASAGHPLIGDSLYGRPQPQKRHMLHAYALSFPHPLTGKPMTIKAPLPEDMKAVLKENLPLKNIQEYIESEIQTPQEDSR
jgi:23S rRNA pseudouridine1911/1915/1917 synthase